jgi:hypothetical protein
VVLMLARAIAEIGLPEGNGLRSALDVPGHHVGSSRLTGGSPPSALWRRRVL